MESGANNVNHDDHQAHSDTNKPGEDTKDDPPPPDDTSNPPTSDSISDPPSSNVMDSQTEADSKLTEQNDDDVSSPPRSEEIHITLETLSPEIDQFLSSLPERMILFYQQTSIQQNQQVTVDEGDGDKNNKEDTTDEGNIAVADDIKDGEKKLEDSEPDKDNENEKDKEEDTNDKTQSEKKQISSIELPDFINKFVDLVDAKIAERDSDDQQDDRKGGKWCKSPDHDSSFLEMVNRFTRLTTSFTDFRSDPVHAPLANRIGFIHHRAMTYLEDEFRFLLQEHSKPIEPDSPDKLGEGGEEYHSPLPESESKNDGEECESPYPGYQEEVVSNLRKIGEAMITAGYESECCQVYMIIRRHAIDECLVQSGFEKISIDELHKMAWENLEREIPIMTAIIKDCATIHFPKEHKLVHSIFPSGHESSLSNLSSSILFTNLARGVLIQFLNFAEGVAMSKRSTEKLFKFLDMYETLRDGFAAIEGLFPEESGNELKSEAGTVKGRIGEAAINIFNDLENSIKNDHGKTPVPGGAVHPLTRYTMNYLKYAFEYKATLENVFRDHSKIERADSTSRPRFEGDSSGRGQDQDNSNNSPFASQLARIMDLLDTNLEEKSQLYRDVSLCCIFMMNNGRYILQKIKSSPEIHSVMGDSWCRRKSSDLRNFHKGYQRETWSKVLGCLAHEGIQAHGKVVKPVLKERFKNFNLMFEEIHRTQSVWVVSDEQLQSELRISISAVVIPAYRGFMGRFSQYFTPGRQYEKYIKFQPEDIENYIEELFDGNAGSMARKRP
ncbi:Exocyst complex component EXO70B1 [Linum grandiflorum]